MIAASGASVVFDMVSLRRLSAILSAMAPLKIVRAKNPESFNKLRFPDRSLGYHDIGLALGDLHG